MSAPEASTPIIRKRKTAQEKRQAEVKKARLAAEQSSLITFPDADDCANVVRETQTKREDAIKSAIALGCHPFVAAINDAIRHWTEGDFDFRDDQEDGGYLDDVMQDGAILQAVKKAGFRVQTGAGSNYKYVRISKEL